MGLFGSSKKVKLSHLKELIVMAMADGKIEKSELATIAAVSAREGLTEEDFKRCLEQPESVEFAIPNSDAERLKYIRDMVLVMMCDGNIDENEIILCKLAAEALGYRHEVVDALVLDVIADIKKELGI